MAQAIFILREYILCFDAKIKNKDCFKGAVNILNLIKHFKKAYNVPSEKKQDKPKEFFSKSIQRNVQKFKVEFDSSADLCIKYISLEDISCAVITLAGMVSKDTVALSVVNPIISADIKGETPLEKFSYIKDYIISAVDQTQVCTYEDAFNMIMSDFALFAVDGCDSMIALGVQGFPVRAVSEPSSELMQRGSREGLVESVNINMTLIRKRLKSPKLKFEVVKLGATCQTSVCLCYMTNKVSENILNKIKKIFLR